MVLVWQTSDRYPWPVWFWTGKSVWFRDLRSDEGGHRGGGRMVVWAGFVFLMKKNVFCVIL